jgi:hypothetical protein
MSRQLFYVLVAMLAAFVLWALLSFLPLQPAHARDDGRYANEPLHAWFDSLASGKGLCCSFADGAQVDDVDWDTVPSCENGKSGGSGNASVPICSMHYRVRLHGEWIIVPDSAVVTEPNKFGPAVVWPYVDAEGVQQIRCFIPGAGA